MIFFLFSKESKFEKKKCFLFEGVKVREDWLVQVNLFYKESKSKKKEKNNFSFYFFFLFFLCVWGVGGGGGMGLSK